MSNKIKKTLHKEKQKDTYIEESGDLMDMDNLHLWIWIDWFWYLVVTIRDSNS